MKNYPTIEAELEQAATKNAPNIHLSQQECLHLLMCMRTCEPTSEWSSASVRRHERIRGKILNLIDNP